MLNNNFNIPKLGFGLMRLPMLGDEVDIEQTKAMADAFLKAGFTYFDTAYGYIGGKSELAVKEVLVNRYPRESYQLATKLPAWAGAKTADEAKAMFTTSLQRTGAGYFDFYLLHNLGENRTESFDKFGIWDYAREQKNKGLIKHLGFSYHDNAEHLDEILTLHPEVEFVQLQINYADWESPTVQSRLCYETAVKHNKPVVIMEPVKGGLLSSPPKPAAELLSEACPGESPSVCAIKWAASLDNVITVLSGMSTIAQMNENLSGMSDFIPMKAPSMHKVLEAGAVLNGLPQIPCTGCRYCVKDCPQGVAIPGIFSAVNKYLVYGNLESAKGGYSWETRDGGTADKCIACGQCESVCPQQLHIIDELKKAYELLG